ncbi:MAG: ATP-binding protein [Candidatus Acidiferrales bacterium]|jgi:DNA replication protein DnaC
MAIETCPFCKGTGWKLVSADKPGSAPGRPGVFAVACDCVAGERAGQQMARARIPRRYEHCDFENFETELADGSYTPEAVRSLKQAKLLAQGFVRDYPGGSDAGLLLMGRSGVGKTHLAVAALKELIKRGHTGFFCEYGKLLREIQDSYNSSSQATEMSILDPVLAAEVLVMDDLGVIKPSDWVRDIIGFILNTRYADASRDLSHRRCTIITTNYLDEPREKKEPPKDPSGRLVVVREETLADRIGTRTRSRLYEMCRTVEVFAPDFRREVRQAGRARV